MKKISFFLISAVIFLYGCSKNVEVNNVSGYLINVSIDGTAQGTVDDGGSKKLSLSTGDHYSDAYYTVGTSSSGVSKLEFPRHNFNLSAFSGEYKITYK